MEDQLRLAEYQSLRHEVVMRAKFLQTTVNKAVTLSLLSIITAFAIWFFTNKDLYLTELFLMMLPLLFAGLIFNLQSNLSTMRAAATYAQMMIKPHKKEKDWEEFFLSWRQQRPLVSAHFGLPLFWPFVIPFGVLVIGDAFVQPLITALFVLDLIALIVAIYGFKQTE